LIAEFVQLYHQAEDAQAGPEPAGGHQRDSRRPDGAPLAQRVFQPPPVVRLRLHPQEPGMARPARQPHRGAAELLQARGGLQPPDPGRELQQDQEAGRVVASAQPAVRAAEEEPDLGDSAVDLPLQDQFETS